MRGLTILGMTSSGRRSLAAYHSPHSLTWRWVLSYQWRFREVWVQPRKWVMFGRMTHNSGGQASLCIGPLSLNYSWQRPVWYRDLYQRLRDERDGFTAKPTSPTHHEGAGLH